MINGLKTVREFHDKLIEVDGSRLEVEANKAKIEPFFYKGKEYDEFIFCHIPKTGGTSINAAFGWSFFYRTPSSYRNLAIGTEHKITDKCLHLNCFIFAFVRNPYDRFVSYYNYLKNKGGMFGDIFWEPHDMAEHNKNLIGETKNISEFLRQENLEKKMMEQDPSAIVPQHVWLPNGADFIGKLENLDNDFKTLTNILKKDLDLPHVNKSIKEATELDKEEKQIIYEFYKRDFELYGYDKDF
jgi:hypothetical protein